MAKDSGRVCYDGSESGLKAAINSGGGDKDSRDDQSRYNSKSTADYDNPVTGKLGAKSGTYGKGQNYAGPYTDSDDHVTPDPRYDDQGNPTFDGGVRELKEVNDANPAAENNEDYIKPMWPSRGLSQRLSKK
jgi:hypothetical protein